VAVSEKARRRWPVGRWIVVAASLVGIVFLAWGLTHSTTLFRSFLMGIGAAFGVMVVAGTAHRFWGGGQIEEAQAPGGWGLRFAGTTRRALRLLEERVDTQMREINDRLYEIEENVYRLGGTRGSSATEE
jgi:hypothetical protein